MADRWEQGSAARAFGDDESAANPYKPLDVAARLKGAKPQAGSVAPTYTPGQLYGCMTPPKPMQPIAPEPAPGQVYAAPQQVYDQPRAQRDVPQAQRDVPQALHAMPPLPPQTPAWTPQPAQRPGVLYSVDLFAHQPTAVMAREDAPFANRVEPPQESWQAIPQVELPQESWQWQPEPQAEWPEEQEGPWRDAFTPAETPRVLPLESPPSSPPRAPVSAGRVIALACALLMLVFCGIVGGRMVLELTRSEREVSQRRSEYLEETGQELYHGAARVDLPPGGQTFVPTATPAPTPFVPTPQPTARESVIAAAAVAGPAATATPSLRTRLEMYPKNPFSTIMESLAPVIAQHPDTVGHLVMPGLVDEMVMQRNNTYYLNHNSLGATSQSGAVFVDQSCSFRYPPENLLLRGQTSVPGKVFAPLWQFVSGGMEFVQSHTVLTLTTLYEEERYVLFAVIVTDADTTSPSHFNYASQPTFTTDESMMHYVQTARSHSLYPFAVDVQATDRLLTLATIGDSNNCLVLMYRMARNGENF